MSRIKLLTGMVVLALFVWLAPAGAEDFDVTSSEAAALAGAEEGSQAALAFDLAFLSSLAHRGVDVAFLELRIPGAGQEETAEFYAYPATSTWTATGLAAENFPERSEQAVAYWTIDPPDYARSGGYVRLDLRELVESWRTGEETNRGIVLVSPQLNAETLGDALASAKIKLVVGPRL